MQRRFTLKALTAAVALAGTGMATGVGFHTPSTAGMFGATAAAVKLLGLTQEQAMMAFGVAGSRASISACR